VIKQRFSWLLAIVVVCAIVAAALPVAALYRSRKLGKHERRAGAVRPRPSRYDLSRGAGKKMINPINPPRQITLKVCRL